MVLCQCPACIEENVHGREISPEDKNRHTKTAQRKAVSSRPRGGRGWRPGAGLTRGAKTAGNRSHQPNPPSPPRLYRSEISARAEAVAVAAQVPAVSDLDLLDFMDWVDPDPNSEAGPSGSTHTPPHPSPPLPSLPNPSSFNSVTITEDTSALLIHPSTPEDNLDMEPLAASLFCESNAMDMSDSGLADPIPSPDEHAGGKDDSNVPDDDDPSEAEAETRSSRFFAAVTLGARDSSRTDPLEAIISRQFSDAEPGPDVPDGSEPDGAADGDDANEDMRYGIERPLPGPVDNNPTMARINAIEIDEHERSYENGDGDPQSATHTHTFKLPPLWATASDVYSESHQQSFVRVVILTVSFLHFEFHIPFAACNILLFMSWGVFRGLDLLPEHDNMPTTLTTAIKRLALDDRFYIVPRCELCHCLFIDHVEEPEEFSCPDCGTAIFRPRKSLAVDAADLLLRRSRKKKRAKSYVPKSVVPFRPVSELIAEMLQQDGMVEKLDGWQRHDRTNTQVLRDMMDGRIWKELKDHEGNLFFGPEATKRELRIGVTLNLDWFNLVSNQNSPSHDVGPISICIANLDATERYQTKNLLVPFILPGPKEQTAEELQQYLKVLVDDFIALYEQGLEVPTITERRVRVAIVAVICDHPAMCKIGGLAEKNHTNAPCTRCDVTGADLKSEESLRNAFEPRDPIEIKSRAREWNELDPSEQPDHFKTHGVRWSELHRLPYFDPVRMLVIDPMHNLLLGIVKHQWYGIWIKREKALRANTASYRRELHDVHELLRESEFPAWLGRLPAQIGIPAGGSLSADEWKTLAIAFGPLALPIVWENWGDQSLAEFYEQFGGRARQAPLEKYDCDIEDYDDAMKLHRLLQKHRASTGQLDPIADANLPYPPEPPESPPPPDPSSPRLKDEDMPLFMKLSYALSILLARSISIPDLDTAYEYLIDYLVDFRKIYGEDALMPNYHFASHLREQILDYGPVYGFWAFLQERLNFTLKHFKTNNHAGGEMEVTLMRSFNAASRLRHLLNAALSYEGSTLDMAWIEPIVRRLLADSTVVRGTVELMAVSGHQLDAQQHERPHILGPIRDESVNQDLHVALVDYYNAHPETTSQFVPDYAASAPENARFLNNRVQVSDYIIIEGRRIVSLGSARVRKAGSSLILVNDVGRGRRAIGEVDLICLPMDRRLPQEPIVHVRWLKRAGISPFQSNLWETYSDLLGLDAWTFGEFETDFTECPSSGFVSWSQIVSQVGRITVPARVSRMNKPINDAGHLPAAAQVHSRPKLWLTIRVGQHGTPL